jgi:antitoxin Phd
VKARSAPVDAEVTIIISWLEILARRQFSMARRSWSVRDAKNRFSEVVEAARRTPQTVTKHGKPAVVVVDVMEYERLRHLERTKAPSFAEFLLTIRKTMANSSAKIFDCAIRNYSKLRTAKVASFSCIVIGPK